MGYGLGVDLGTSFTRAAISRAGRVRMVPLGEHSALIASVVRVQADGSLATGSDADPSRTGRDFKRRLGDPTPLVIGGQPHSAVSLLAATLRSVLETVTRLEESPPDHVVLSYPAVWGPYRREQFAEVPRRAGLAEPAVTITTEPEAAATYYASVRQLTEGDLVAVYDLGGGTFDTTVTRTTGSGPARSATQILGVPEGVEWVGGVDFDEAVLAFLDRATGGAVAALDPRDPASATALRGVRDECIRVKEALSESDAVTAVVTLPGRRTEVSLTRADFEDMIRTPLESTLAALRRTLASAAVTPAELAGVLLVGGSSRIPLVSRMLSADLGRPVLVDPQPQHCVALGAAALAEQAASAPARPVAGSAAASVGSAGRVGGVRQRVFAATAVAALLVGGAAWSTWPNDQTAPPAAAATIQPPGLIGSASTTEAPKPQPTPTKASGPSKAKPPTLPFTSAVLGIDTKCLDVANASTLDGTTVGLFGCNGTGAQTWAFGKDGTVRALHKCLDGDDKDGVLLNTCDGGAGQRWRRDGDRLVSAKSKLCLDVLGKRPTDRAPVVTTPCTTTASTAGGSQIWTVQTRKQAGAVNASAAVPHRLRTVTGLGRKPQGVAVSPDGTRAYVASVEGNSLAVIDTRDGALLRTIKMPAAPQYVVAAPDGRRLYVTLDRGSTQANSVQVVDTLTGRLLNRVDVGPTLYPPALSPNGLLLYVPDRTEFQIALVDTFTYLVPARIAVAPAPQGTAFSPDGLRVYASGGDSGTVSVLDVATNTVTATIPAGRNPLGLAVSPDGTRLAVADYNSGSVRLIDTGTNTVVDTVTVGSKPRGVSFAADGRHLYVADSGSHSVSVIDVQTARISATIRVGGTPWTIAVTPNGKQAYVSDAAGNRVSVLSTGR